MVSILFLDGYMNSVSKTVSLYNWDAVENKAKNLNLDRSKYIQTLVNRDVNKKINRSSIVYVGLYLLLALTIVLIVLR